MPRLLLLTLAATAALATAAVTAAPACPAPRPGDPPCSKYRLLQEPAFAPVYLRTQRGVLALRTTSARARRHLVGSTWAVLAPGPTVPVIRVLDPSNMPDVVDTAVRTVIVRAVTWRNGHYEVELDGLRYAIERCRDGQGRLTSCLIQRSP